MKKKIFAAVMAVVAGLAVLTGCQNEKPYAAYEIAYGFQGLPEKPKDDDRSYEEWFESLPAYQKDRYAIAEYMAGWLVNHGYIRTKNNKNPIVIEGDDLSLSDPQAYAIYKNLLTELDQVDLNEVIRTAQTKPEFGNKLELTSSETVSFQYFITGITTLPLTDARAKWYSVSYGPLTPNPDNL